MDMILSKPLEISLVPSPDVALTENEKYRLRVQASAGREDELDTFCKWNSPSDSMTSVRARRMVNRRNQAGEELEVLRTVTVRVTEAGAPTRSNALIWT